MRISDWSSDVCSSDLEREKGYREGAPALQHAALDLVALDALEQGLEVAFAEAFVALALDDLEEDRAERVRGEDLQQLALVGFREIGRASCRERVCQYV